MRGTGSGGWLALVRLEPRRSAASGEPFLWWARVLGTERPGPGRCSDKPPGFAGTTCAVRAPVCRPHGARADTIPGTLVTMARAFCRIVFGHERRAEHPRSRQYLTHVRVEWLCPMPGCRQSQTPFGNTAASRAACAGVKTAGA